ncbi:MAG: CsbD family protein [Acidobacteriota bacterium]|nr:CsbD family protein [Acidobacteriota bacterium]
MQESTKDKIQGAAHELKGAVKEKAGKALNNPDMETEGTAEKLGGKVQKKVGDVEKVFEK